VTVPHQPTAVPPPGGAPLPAGNAPLPTPIASQDARIVDRGYRRYEGVRLGARGAERALFVASVQRALGLRRRFRHKIIPLLVAAMAYLPAAVFVGAAALIPDRVARDLVPDYGGYYGFVTSAILLFVAAVVPDVLCSDRRSGMLGLYLAAPLTRDTYVAMKAAAVGAVVTLVTLGPPVLLLVGYSFVDLGPGWPADGLLLLLRIIAAGLAVAAWYTALAMVASALTDRRAVASAAIVLATLVSTAVVGALVEGAGASEWLRLADLFDVPFELVYRIYGQAGQYPDLPTLPLVLVYLALVAAAFAFVRQRYQRLEVTK
jgi:ABC-2 type transport system permease protein